MADKIIKNFSIDLSDLPEVGASRDFTIKGDEGSEFILEVKDIKMFKKEISLSLGAELLYMRLCLFVFLHPSISS